jgi:hypothetical protein
MTKYIDSWLEKNAAKNAKKWGITEAEYRKNFSEAYSEVLTERGRAAEDDSKFEAVSTPPVPSSPITGTSSSNPARPRTLSAGYDSETGTMTVLFRDGTWWEYRDVPGEVWLGFKEADSKGRYLRSSGLDGWDNMGPADVGAMSRHRRVQLNELTNWATSMYGNE